MAHSIIIGFDPGINNFGYAVVKFTNHRPKILDFDLLASTVKELTNDVFLIQCQAFALLVKSIIKKYGPKRLIMERFINRGRFFAALVEKISVMIGIAQQICSKAKVTLLVVTSASWKNAFQRETKQDLKVIYKTYKPLPPHCIDSLLLTLYGYTKLNSYTDFNFKLLRRARRKWLRLMQNA
jgi:Holliday junction resolvasome RuvABC endonuclease subunit